MTADRPIAPLTMLGGTAAACEGPDCLVPDAATVGSSTGSAAAAD